MKGIEALNTDRLDATAATASVALVAGPAAPLELTPQAYFRLCKAMSPTTPGITLAGGGGGGMPNASSSTAC